MFANIRGVGLFGMNSFGVNVEVEISKGIEKLEIVGLGDTAVRERSVNSRCGACRDGIF